MAIIAVADNDPHAHELLKRISANERTTHAPKCEDEAQMIERRARNTKRTQRNHLGGIPWWSWQLNTDNFAMPMSHHRLEHRGIIAYVRKQVWLAVLDTIARTRPHRQQADA
jgi:hypothetical protein